MAPDAKKVAAALALINRGAPVREAVADLTKDEMVDLSHRVKWGYDHATQREQLTALIAEKG